MLYKELRVALLCGVALAVANFARMWLLKDLQPAGLDTMMVVSAAMLVAVVVAKVMGCTLPIAVKLVRLDPALMAGPMITTIVDAVSLILYFALAKWMLM